jgi:hypothetical protein
MHPLLKVTESGGDLAAFKKSLSAIAAARVYVGVPEDKSARRDGQITNAALVYLHTNGSPLTGLPARPIIEPAIEAPETRDNITREMRNAARSTLDKRPDEAKRHLNSAGMLGRNAAIRWFTDPRNNWEPDKPETIKRKGSDRTLIDKDEMRRSISYLVED